MILTEREIELFWSKVDKSGPGDCWLWTAATTRPGGDKPGYGIVNLKRDGKRKTVVATRVSLNIDGRPRPDDRALALHSCDNPLCVNPAHLRWGTWGDNMEDAFKRGKALNSCNFSPAQVRKIRDAEGTLNAIASEFGCSFVTVSHIKRRIMYSYVD